MTDRSTVLELANEYITKDRAATHGGAEDSFKTIAAFWSEYLGTSIEKHDVCAMMVLLKLARIKGNPSHLDSWIDVAGYAALGGEITSCETGFTDLVRNGAPR